MIPDEAVEAAARMFYLPRNWNTASDTTKANLRFDMEAALEAAAPYIQSAAWERGTQDGYHHRPNPYKKDEDAL